MLREKKKSAKASIGEIIANSSVAVSHQDIKARLNGNFDRVTIYRGLDRLVEEGLVHKIIDRDGVSKYAACSNCSHVHHHNHVHFSCTACNAVTCLDNVVPSFQMPPSYSVAEVNFTVTGLCPDCSK